MTGYPDGYPPPPQQQPYGNGYPGGYPDGYPPAPQQPSAQGPKNGLGIAALVLAIVGLLACWTVVGGVLFGIAAVVLGFLGRGRAKSGQANNGGVATAGVALGFLAIVASLAFIAIWSAAFHDVGGTQYMDCVARAGNDREAVDACVKGLMDDVESQFSPSSTAPR